MQVGQHWIVECAKKDVSNQLLHEAPAAAMGELNGLFPRRRQRAGRLIGFVLGHD
jgi:hypothetical protein